MEEEIPAPVIPVVEIPKQVVKVVRVIEPEVKPVIQEEKEIKRMKRRKSIPNDILVPPTPSIQPLRTPDIPGIPVPSTLTENVRILTTPAAPPCTPLSFNPLSPLSPRRFFEATSSMDISGTVRGLRVKAINKAAGTGRKMGISTRKRISRRDELLELEVR